MAFSQRVPSDHGDAAVPEGCQGYLPSRFEDYHAVLGKLGIDDPLLEIARRLEEIALSDDYFVMVGLADVTVGEQKVNGSTALLANDTHHYGGDVFVDGRVAFYLKSKYKGKYLITAQLDTNEDDIGEIFKNLHKKDAKSAFRRLDPDLYYPTYGDDSTIIDDTDSMGKFYVRVEWDKSQALWGNYNTSLTGTELAQFNRTLYGAQLDYRSPEVTRYGEHRTIVNAFASEAQSAFRHNQFLGTGGSLYYLKDQDIVVGSEKVWVEVRQRGSERVVESIVLQEGRDYEIDDFQGRIILTRPLTQVAADTSGPSIVRDTPLDGNDVYLLVDYEYVPDGFEGDDVTYGARGKHWFGDNIAVGGTFVHENRTGQDYELRGVDVTYQAAQGTYLKLEYAESDSLQTDASYKSDDGGLSFEEFLSNTLPANANGSAWSLEGRAELSELSGGRYDGTVGFWYKKRDAGFSNARLDSGREIEDYGIEGRVRVNDKLDISARATVIESKADESLLTPDHTRESAASVQADYRYSERVTLSAELRYVEMKDFITINPVDPMYRAVYADGSTLFVRHGREAMTQEIREFANAKEAAAFGDFCDWLEKLYRAEMDSFIDANFDSPLDLIKPWKSGLDLVRLGGFGKLGKKVSSFFDDERLQRIFSFQSMYAGLAPYEALALYAVITYMDTVAGVYSVRGGVSAIADALARQLDRRGVEFVHDAPITAILRRSS